MTHFMCPTKGCKTYLMDGFCPLALKDVLNAVGFSRVQCPTCHTVIYVDRAFSGSNKIFTEGQFNNLHKASIDDALAELRKAIAVEHPGAKLYELGVDQLPPSLPDPRQQSPAFIRPCVLAISSSDLRLFGWDGKGQLRMALLESAVIQ
jgi:hypothetical protein